MYINERDQINFHGFLKSAREWLGVSQNEVAKGICTTTTLHRAESGSRMPEKMLRDRLVSRMGFASEGHIEYLGLLELQQMQCRQKIVQAIMQKDIPKGEHLLKEWISLCDENNAVQQQFIKTMEFLILRQKEAPQDVLCKCIKEAIECTIPSIDKALIGRHLLADQEINLIAEYIYLQSPVGSNESHWRLLEYQKLIFYMKHSHMEKLVRVKVYPKIVCSMCEEVLKDGTTVGELRDILKQCDNALELLLDTHRLYYFYELLVYRKKILLDMLEYSLLEEEHREIDVQLAENERLERLWEAQYKAYGVSPYTDNFLYLYWETEYYNAVEVIEVRRKMLGIPRAVLREGICTERSLIRIERSNFNPSLFVMRDLFERLGLCGEYRRTEFVTTDIQRLKEYRKLCECLNAFAIEEAFAIFQELCNTECAEISYNMQILKRIEYMIQKMKSDCHSLELYSEVLEALESTIPIWALYHSLDEIKMYFTHSELACICDMAFDVQAEESLRCKELIGEICQKELEKGIPAVRLGIMEYVINRYTFYLRNSGREQEAEKMQTQLIRTCLHFKRMPYTFANPEQLNAMWIE